MITREVNIPACACNLAAWHQSLRESYKCRPKSADTIRLCCWNLLNDGYDQSQLPYLNYDWNVHAPHRKMHRWAEIVEMNDVDILCLQEDEYFESQRHVLEIVSHDASVTSQSKTLAYAGYQFLKPFRSATDAMSIYYNTSRFKLIGYSSSTFAQLLAKNPLYPAMKSRYGSFPASAVHNLKNGFQLLSLRDTRTGIVYVIANTHLFYHNLADAVRLYQIYLLLEEIRSTVKMLTMCSDNDVRPILAGDLNSKSDTGVIRLMNGETIECSDTAYEMFEEWLLLRTKNMTGFPEDVSFPQVKSGVFPLKSPFSFSQYIIPGMTWSNNVGGFKAVLDYIFVCNKIKIVNTMKWVDEPAIEKYDPEQHIWNEEEVYALPTATFPSDHIPLLIDFE